MAGLLYRVHLQNQVCNLSLRNTTSPAGVCQCSAFGRHGKRQGANLETHGSWPLKRLNHAAGFLGWSRTRSWPASGTGRPQRDALTPKPETIGERPTPEQNLDASAHDRETTGSQEQPRENPDIRAPWEIQEKSMALVIVAKDPYMSH